jgi:hypothetical protein
VQPLLSWKNKSVTQLVGVFVALGTQHPVRMRRIVICGLSGCIPFFQIISIKVSKKIIEHKMFISSFSATLKLFFSILRITE